MKKPHYKYIYRDCTYLNKQIRIEAAIEEMPKNGNGQDEWTVTYRCECQHCPTKKDCEHMKIDIEHYPKITTSFPEVLKKVDNHA